MNKKCYVIGTGGRELAMRDALSRSTFLHNPDVQCVAWPLSKHEAQLLSKADLVVVGPEAALEAGIVDSLRVPVFGPTCSAARIETSKAYARKMMASCGVPGPHFLVVKHAQACDGNVLKSLFETNDVAAKPDGTCGGKGVRLLCVDDTQKHVEQLLRTHDSVVIEEVLQGYEVSVIALVDTQQNVLVLPPCQDHKTLHNFGAGPNTGGLGAITSGDILSARVQSKLVTDVFTPILDAMKAQGILYTGALYAGIMMTCDGPKVLEFNARFGDPETQALLASAVACNVDFGRLVYTACTSVFDDACKQSVQQWHEFVKHNAACAVVLASKDYCDPTQQASVHHMDALCRFEPEDPHVHLTKYVKFNAPGRVACVTSVQPSVQQAAQRVYESLRPIRTHVHFRTDIGSRYYDTVNVAVASSSRGTTFERILDIMSTGTVNICVKFVASNRRQAYVLERARRRGIPSYFFKQQAFEERVSYLCNREEIHVLLLIGYNRILTPTFLGACSAHVINVHPSLLPRHAGLYDHAVHQAVVDACESVSGCTVHVVINQVDAGRVIVQKECDASDCCVEQLRQRVQALEPGALVEAVLSLARDKVTHEHSITYENAGVNTHTADEFVSQLSTLAKQTQTDVCNVNIGSFAARVNVRQCGVPILLCADGVGTKCMLAQSTQHHVWMGMDLVAMNANDAAVDGGIPVAFLDYIATSKLHAGRALAVVRGITDACAACGAALVGGETAELPGLFSHEHAYDLAGFMVSAQDPNYVEYSASEGDVVYGIPSVGLHANGFSLVRKLLCTGRLDGVNLDDLLVPTPLYVSLLRSLRELTPAVHFASAHITGGGIPANLSRVLPDGTQAVLDYSKWKHAVPPILLNVIRAAHMLTDDALDTFNCGIGLTLVVRAADIRVFEEFCASHAAHCLRIGKIVTETPSNSVVEHACHAKVDIINAELE